MKFVFSADEIGELVLNHLVASGVLDKDDSVSAIWHVYLEKTQRGWPVELQIEKKEKKETT